MANTIDREKIDSISRKLNTLLENNNTATTLFDLIDVAIKDLHAAITEDNQSVIFPVLKKLEDSRSEVLYNWTTRHLVQERKTLEDIARSLRNGR